MKSWGRIFLSAVCALGLAGVALAQFGMRQPTLEGVWSPKVGAGSAYEITSKDGKHTMEIYCVGTESVDGGLGYWLEMFMPSAEHGSIIGKNLMVVSGKEVGIKRMIVQMPGQEPMEFESAMMMRPGQQRQAKSAVDFRDKAERVGTETITTPAGTFECEHYRSKEDGSDLWISAKVTPYGAVKMVTKDSTMVLTKVITDAKSRITGTPRKFDPSQMMRQQPPQE